jgi:hypothetical protein
MGTYTIQDKPIVDAVIEGHMQLLKSLCVTHIGANLVSLVLGGSFGRGEGSVLIDRNGTVEPLRDYDVRLIVRQPVLRDRIERVRAEFMRLSKLGDTDEHFSGQRGFSLTLEPLTQQQLTTSFVRDRDLRAYDFLNASQVLFGEDHAPALRFPAASIPKVNGLRLLYKKMIGLVGHRDRLAIAGDVRRTLIYECDKTFVEICTALVLLAGAYVASYQARAELFAQHWQDWFPDLARDCPDLSDQIYRATQEKLCPGSTSVLPADQAFEQARAALLAVHRFYVRQLYGLEVTPGQTSTRQLRGALTQDFFKVAVRTWLQQRHLSGKLSSAALNTAYHHLLRRAFARSAGQRGVRALWESARASEAPQIDIFLAAWCALAALGEQPCDRLLQCANVSLDRLPGVSSSRAQLVGWPYYSATRERLVRAFSLWQQSR